MKDEGFKEIVLIALISNLFLIGVIIIKCLCY